MKQIYSLLLLLFLGAGFSARAQSLSVQHDTVALNVSGSYTAVNNITNLTADTITVQWQITETNFPADWMDLTGVCDMNGCYSSTMIWPSIPNECRYPPGMGDFHLQGNVIPVLNDGPYYMRVSIKNKDVPADMAIQTYVIGRKSAGIAYANKSAGDDAIVLYPNPATTSLNILFNGVTGVAAIGIYSIIGRQMKMYSTLDNSASLNIENLPAGIYFVKLLNAQGYALATQKFTKQ